MDQRKRKQTVYHPIYKFCDTDTDFKDNLILNCLCIMTEILKAKRKNNKKMSHWIDAAIVDVTNISKYKISRLSKTISNNFAGWHGWVKEHGNCKQQSDEYLLFHFKTNRSTDDYTVAELIPQFIEEFGRDHVHEYHLRNES